jgi:hypothetical protein
MLAPGYFTNAASYFKRFEKGLKLSEYGYIPH